MKIENIIEKATKGIELSEEELEFFASYSGENFFCELLLIDKSLERVYIKKTYKDNNVEIILHYYQSVNNTDKNIFIRQPEVNIIWLS